MDRLDIRIRFTARRPTKCTSCRSHSGILQRISDVFEGVLLQYTLFDVSGSNKPRPKRRFRMKRMNHDGCICAATVRVRLFTISSEETTVEPSPGDTTICPFHPESAHFSNLLLILTLTSPPSFSQVLTAPPSQLATITDGSND
jgi:hypothetical protein